MKKLGQIKIDFYDDHCEQEVNVENVETQHLALAIARLIERTGVTSRMHDEMFDDNSSDDQKPYNAKLVCIDADEAPDFTKGKIYEIKDGILYGDHCKFGADFDNNEPFVSLEQINDIMAAQFIELVQE